MGFTTNVHLRRPRPYGDHHLPRSRPRHRSSYDASRARRESARPIKPGFVTTRFGYDALGRLTSVTDALDQVTSYTYDELGNRLTQTDANGRTTTFEYDRIGRQTARILPGDSRESMTYNDDGSLATYTDFGGNTRTFEYDANRRLVRRAYPDGTEHLFSYTATGRRETATDARGVTSYAYDSRDRLLEKQDPNGHRLTYTYDIQGNLETLTATVGTASYTSSYGYDALNRQVTVTDPQGGVSGLTYDANSNRVSLSHANGLVTSYNYDPLNRLKLLETVDTSTNILQSFSYTLGPSGHRSQIDEADGTTRSYQYDDLYRLTQDRVTDGAGELMYQHDFGYDPVGNRLSQTIEEGAGPSIITSTFDERDRILTAASSTYSWDLDGKLVARNTDILDWNFDQRLTSMELDDGTVVDTVYDVDGNRVQVTAIAPGEIPLTTDYLVDTRGILSHVVAEIFGLQAETVYVRSEDELLSLVRPASAATRHFHSDGLGSIRALTNQTGTVTDSYQYSAFGKLLSRYGDDEQPYKFAGEPYDPNLSFYFNRARWMNPEHGRFISSDPFAGLYRAPQSLHKYVYAHNLPTLLTDPSGLTTGVTGFTVASAARGIVSGVRAVSLRTVHLAAINSLFAVVLLYYLSRAVSIGPGSPWANDGEWSNALDKVKDTGQLAAATAIALALLRDFLKRAKERLKDKVPRAEFELQLPSGRDRTPQKEVLRRRFSTTEFVVKSGGKKGRVFQIVASLNGQTRGLGYFKFRMDYLDFTNDPKGVFLPHCHVVYPPFYTHGGHRNCFQLSEKPYF